MIYIQDQITRCCHHYYGHPNLEACHCMHVYLTDLVSQCIVQQVSSFAFFSVSSWKARQNCLVHSRKNIFYWKKGIGVELKFFVSARFACTDARLRFLRLVHSAMLQMLFNTFNSWNRCYIISSKFQYISIVV